MLIRDAEPLTDSLSAPLRRPDEQLFNLSRMPSSCCRYRKDSSQGSDSQPREHTHHPTSFYAWHQHRLEPDYAVLSTMWFQEGFGFEAGSSQGSSSPGGFSSAFPSPAQTYVFVRQVQNLRLGSCEADFYKMSYVLADHTNTARWRFHYFNFLHFPL